MLTQTETILSKLDERYEGKPGGWRATLMGMYKEGASDREVLCALGLSRGTWDTLLNAQVECDFAELVDMGRVFAHAWWETAGRMNLQNPKFQTGLYTIQMKNRFGWSEKSETSMTNLDLGNMEESELDRKVQQLLRQYEQGRGKTAV